MAWTAPRTWAPEEGLTAALLNTHLRDNMLETEAAKATGDSGFFVTTALNTIALRTPQQTQVITSGTTTSTTYTAVLTGSSTCAVTAVTGTTVLILFSAQYQNSGIGQTMTSFAVSGATTAAATDSAALIFEDATAYPQQHMRHAYYNVTAGTNTFTMQHRVESGTGTYSMRRIFVFPT